MKYKNGGSRQWQFRNKIYDRSKEGCILKIFVPTLVIIMHFISFIFSHRVRPWRQRVTRGPPMFLRVTPANCRLNAFESWNRSGQNQRIVKGRCWLWRYKWSYNIWGVRLCVFGQYHIKTEWDGGAACNSHLCLKIGSFLYWSPFWFLQQKWYPKCIDRLY